MHLSCDVLALWDYISYAVYPSNQSNNQSINQSSNPCLAFAVQLNVTKKNGKNRYGHARLSSCQAILHTWFKVIIQYNFYQIRQGSIPLALLITSLTGLCTYNNVTRALKILCLRARLIRSAKD